MKAGAILLALCTILLSATPAFARNPWFYKGYGWHACGWNDSGWNNYRWNNNGWNNYRWSNYRWNPNAYYGSWHRPWNGYPAGYGYWNQGRHIGWGSGSYTHNRPWH